MPERSRLTDNYLFFIDKTEKIKYNNKVFLSDDPKGSKGELL
jgi:hypothetical protein